MSDFPQLKTGAVLQYPAAREYSFRTEIIKFVDGGEQRFRSMAAPIRRWVIRLDLLNELEMASFEEFFRSQNGRANRFSFIDPWTGVSVPNCSLERDELQLEFSDVMSGKTTLNVIENLE